MCIDYLILNPISVAKKSVLIGFIPILFRYVFQRLWSLRGSQTKEIPIRMVPTNHFVYPKPWDPPLYGRPQLATFTLIVSLPFDLNMKESILKRFGAK